MKLSKKIKNKINNCNYENENHEKELCSITINFLYNIFPKIEHLEKENEEMLNALIKIFQQFYKIYDRPSKYYDEHIKMFYEEFGEYIKLIEKIKNKSWEEICE